MTVARCEMVCKRLFASRFLLAIGTVSERSTTIYLRGTNEDAHRNQVKLRSFGRKKAGPQDGELYACVCGVATRWVPEGRVLESRGE